MTNKNKLKFFVKYEIQKSRRQWMNEIKGYNEIVFENIKYTDEYGNEYWLARELQKALEYKRWDKC